MPRYELIEGTSSKFWEVELRGKSFTTRYGRIGTDGQATTKTFKSEAEAKKEYDKIVAEKLKKGYEPAGGGKKAATPAVAAVAAPAPRGAGLRYELVDGTSSKFWEIELDGKSFTTRYGKIGTEGLETRKDFKSEAEAKKAHDKIILEKTLKGYFMVASGVAPAPVKKTPPVKLAENPALEQAIRDDPDDAAAWLVYADWLQAHGDPQGELVSLDAGIAGGKKALQKARDAHFAAHVDALLGELAPAVEQEAVALEWRFGFIDAARVAIGYEVELENDAAEIVAKLLALPAARFLRKLTLGLASNDGENDYDDVVKSIVAAKRKPPLRELFLGDYQYPDDTEISWTTIGDLSRLWGAYPGLRSVKLRGTNLKLGKIDAPELSSFVLESGGTGEGALKSIAAAAWPKLETLEVWTGSSQYNFDGSVKDLQPILDGKGLPRLKRLAIVNSELADDLARALPRSKILGQLEALDLSRGIMTDEGAKAIAAAKDAFKHLGSLDLSENMIADPALLAQLKKVCKGAVVDGQREGDEYDGEVHRYVSVGE